MCNQNSYSNLNELEWISIPGVDYIVKYKFFADQYCILVTNLKEIFGENVDKDQVQRRFSDLNVHVKMKTSVILRNVEKSFNMALTGNEVIFKADCFEKSIKIQVQFTVNKVFLTFNFEPLLLSTHELRSHIVVPIISHALLIYQENIDLKKKLSQLENGLNLKPDDLLDNKKDMDAIDLISKTNVSDGVVINSFLSAQRGMQSCFVARKAVIKSQRTNVSESCDNSQMPMKKESLSVRFQYDEKEDGEEGKDSLLLQLPLKRTSPPSEDLYNVQACNPSSVSPLNLEETKKKKSFKF